VVAELDATGYKRAGYIFASGMRVAAQTIWNPGYGSQVTWEATSPVTGSQYTLDTGAYVTRKGINLLGADMTDQPNAEKKPRFIGTALVNCSQ
jgi:hypothetical protein